MEHPTQPIAVAEPVSEVPEGIRRARVAFLRDYPRLHADRKTRGKFVAYHLENMVAVTSGYLPMIRLLNVRSVPVEASLIFRVTPDTQVQEQGFADEIEINPE